MAYAIMRCEKISTKGNLAASISHAYRTRETENANPRISNEIIVEYDKTKVDQEVEQARTRKDNVIMYDVFLGVSPEWYEKSSSIDFTKWKQNSIEWLKEEFGEENIKSVVLHRDEQTRYKKLIKTYKLSTKLINFMFFSQFIEPTFALATHV